MGSFAHLTIVGNLGKDPVFTDGESPVARFSVAVTRKRKDGDLTTWWNVTVWRGQAKVAAQYLKKGSQVLVSGTPYLDTYLKDGVNKEILKLDANDIQLLGSARETSAESAPRPVARPVPAPVSTDDEPPF